MMNGGPISWKSRRQDNVSLSTSEADFVAASQAAQEVVYLREALRDVAYQQCTTTGIFEDNLACIALSENPVRQKISRHTDIRRYFIREFFLKQELLKLFHFEHTKWWLMHRQKVCLHCTSQSHVRTRPLFFEIFW